LDDLAEESFVINGPCRGYPTVGILQRACWASRKPFLTPARTVDQSFRNALNLAQAGVSDILKAVKTLGLGERWKKCVTATGESGPNKDNKTQALTGQG